MQKLTNYSIKNTKVNITFIKSKKIAILPTKKNQNNKNRLNLTFYSFIKKYKTYKNLK